MGTPVAYRIRLSFLAPTYRAGLVDVILVMVQDQDGREKGARRYLLRGPPG